MLVYVSSATATPMTREPVVEWEPEFFREVFEAVRWMNRKRNDDEDSDE